MKDFLGRPIELGDYVFHQAGDRYHVRRYGRVVRMTKKMIEIECLKTDRFWHKTGELFLIDPANCVIVVAVEATE